MRFLIKILLISFSIFLTARIDSFASIDSTRIAVRQMPNDTNKVKELCILSNKYNKNQIDTALSLASDALKLSEILNYNKGIALSNYHLGIVYKYLNELKLSEDSYNKSLKLAREISDKEIEAKCLNGLGNVYKRFGDFEGAISSFYKALDISQQLKDTILLSAINNNLGVIYFNLKDYDNAINKYLKVIDLNKNKKDVGNIHTFYMNIANAYDVKGDVENSIYYYKLALDNLKNKDNKYDRLLLIHNLGTVLEKKGNLYEAMQCYTESINLSEEVHDRNHKVFALQGIGNCYRRMGQFDEAIKYLEQSYSLACEINDIKKQYSVISSLYIAYEGKKDYKNAFKRMKKYIQIEDSVFKLEKKVLLVELEEKYQAKQKEQQIAYLEKEQEMQKVAYEKKEADARQKSFQRNVLIIAIILVLILTLYISIESKRRHKINLLLANQNKKIIDQRAKIEIQNEKLLESNKTKDKLFQIIAHDLRSPIISIESITHLIPYWIEEQDYDSLLRLSKTLELSVNNVLALIDNLLNWALSQQGKFPYHPETLDLKENIQETIDVYVPIAKLKNIEITFKSKIGIIVFADRNMLFAVVRNLINNAIKFTPEKGTIEVGIECNLSFAKIWVKDSGVGIAREKKELVFEFANGSSTGTNDETGKGLGLFFCKEFVNMNHGEIFIESETGEGTTVSFTLPLFNMQDN